MMVTKQFHASGTTCGSCSEIIIKQALKVKGVKEAEFDYAAGIGKVSFDEKKTDMLKIFESIEKKGYICKETVVKGGKGMLGWIFAFVGIITLGYFILGLTEKIPLPEISSTMSYGLLFIVGILTGFHCIAMCGGFVVSYSVNNKKRYGAHFMYASGKLVSYTLIGAMFGLLGSIIAFTPKLRAAAGITAGVFLILFGLRSLGIFPILRRFSFTTPSFMNRFIGEKSSSGPLVIGLLNGLMIACGPLQAIYVLAAGTGSMVEGAKLLFIFGLGTLPVMLGFGYLTSFVSQKATHNILKLSGAIVILLGLVMVNNGLALSGSGYDLKSIMGRSNVVAPLADVSAADDSGVIMNGGYQEIHMDVLASGYSPDTFVLKKGVPVKWIIDGKTITGCNRAIQVPKYGMNFNIKPGLQTIEFTPQEEGIVSWSCWMGMIPGTFIVKDDIDLGSPEQVTQVINANPPVKPAGSCSMGCGCGMGG